MEKADKKRKLEKIKELKMLENSINEEVSDIDKELKSFDKRKVSLLKQKSKLVKRVSHNMKLRNIIIDELSKIK